MTSPWHFGAQAGQFELNVMLPGMTRAVLDSTDMLKNFLPIYAKNMIDGIRANEQKLESYVQKSPMLVTLLNPFIGYMKLCRDIQTFSQNKA